MKNTVIKHIRVRYDSNPIEKTENIMITPHNVHAITGFAYVKLSSTLCAKFFKDIVSDTQGRLHHLLPPMRDNVYNLREHKSYSLAKGIKTNRFKSSFINHAILNYQQ